METTMKTAQVDKQKANSRNVPCGNPIDEIRQRIKPLEGESDFRYQQRIRKLSLCLVENAVTGNKTNKIEFLKNPEAYRSKPKEKQGLFKNFIKHLAVFGKVSRKVAKDRILHRKSRQKED